MIPDQKGGTTNDDNVIIVGSLNTEALTASVDQLVKHVKDKTEEMTGSFRKSVSEINTVVKTLKDANVGDGGDGGGSKRTTSNKREQSSVESLTLSYYKLLGSLQFYNRQAQVIENKNWCSSSNDDIQKYIEAIKQVKEINDKIAKNRSDFAMANAEAISRSYAFSGKEVQTFVESLSKGNRELQDMAAHYKRLEAESGKVFKADFAAALKMPTTDIDKMRAKLERLRELMQGSTALNIISSDKVAKAKQEIESLAKAIEHHRRLMEESETIDGSASQAISQKASAEQQATNATQQTVNAKKEELEVEKKITNEYKIRGDVHAQAQMSYRKNNVAYREKGVSAGSSSFDSPDFKSALAGKLGISPNEVILANAKHLRTKSMQEQQPKQASNAKQYAQEDPLVRSQQHMKSTFQTRSSID